MSESEALRRGSEIRRQVLGEEYVQQTAATTDPVMRKFTQAATEIVWGTIWTRPGLDLKTKALICVVSDAATGRAPELELHLRMALRQGWTADELTDAFVHLSGYVGMPLAREAFLVASKVFAEVQASLTD